MAKRSDLAQKLLDDLRQKKQQMGLANAAGHHRRADTSRSGKPEISNFSMPSARSLDSTFLHKMVECDIENTKPCVNCMWDLGWNCRIFATQDIDLAIKDIERHIFSTLLGEVLKELL